MEERSDRRKQDKGKKRWIIISTRERNKTQSGIPTESLGSEVSMLARGWLMGFKMFRVCQEWSDVFGNGVHRFRNAY